MKKNYSSPSVTIYQVETENIMGASKGIVTATDDGNGVFVGGSQAGSASGGDVDASQYRSGLWN